MKKIIIISMLLWVTVSLAQLPSWGMTEQQYKMPNRASKLADIGTEAVKNKWQLKVIAPQAWHSSIRAGLSQDGDKNVMMTFKDSLHKSISISASKAKHMGQTVGRSNTQVVQKQVVIDDKPEIDTSVERPEFSDEFMTGKPVVADIDLELDLPKTAHKVAKKADEKPVTKPVAKPQNKAVVKTETKAEPKPAVVTATQAPVANSSHAVDTESATRYLRKRFAKNKTINGQMAYERITENDELFIKDGVVMIKQEKNNRPFYYLMSEPFDATKHAFKEKSSERYVKTEPATSTASTVKKAVKKDDEVKQDIERTSLVFNAVDDNLYDQDDLRRDHIRNKMVTKSYGADKLKSGDLIYTQNDTALVVRRLSRTNEIYFWLKGEVNVTENVTMMRPDEFKIK